MNTVSIGLNNHAIMHFDSDSIDIRGGRTMIMLNHVTLFSCESSQINFMSITELIEVRNDMETNVRKRTKN